MPEQPKAMNATDWAQLFLAVFPVILPVILEIIKALRGDPAKANEFVQMMKGIR